MGIPSSTPRSSPKSNEQQLLDLIANNSHGVIAAVTEAGYPHLTNVLYSWDPEQRIARVSTTADRVKGRILRSNPHAALHVSGSHSYAYAVAECDAEMSEIATTPGDDACRELLAHHSTVAQKITDQNAFYTEMVQANRVMVRLRVRRVYGVVLERPPDT